MSSPYEPGSVNKVVTASSVIEYGLTNPTKCCRCRAQSIWAASPSTMPGTTA
ncbi:peptidoglycan synthase FtsI domain protein [Mycobacterium xenopi 3993]|nr:peptidoglycan synthase FtsI domain protein [Mycobacterium xenopi 3993]